MWNWTDVGMKGVWTLNAQLAEISIEFSVAMNTNPIITLSLLKTFAEISMWKVETPSSQLNVSIDFPQIAITFKDFKKINDSDKIKRNPFIKIKRPFIQCFSTLRIFCGFKSWDLNKLIKGWIYILLGTFSSFSTWQLFSLHNVQNNWISQRFITKAATLEIPFRLSFCWKCLDPPSYINLHFSISFSLRILCEYCVERHCHAEKR